MFLSIWKSFLLCSCKILALCYGSGLFLPSPCPKLQELDFYIVSQFLHIPLLWFNFFHILCFFGLVPIFYLQTLILFLLLDPFWLSLLSSLVGLLSFSVLIS